MQVIATELPLFSEFGRLPKDASSWIAKLLDLNIVELRGQMTDCPERLSTGATLIISVEVFILHTAFNQISPSRDDDVPRHLWGEGLETVDEANLRQRKASLLKLFSVLGLRPEYGVDASKNAHIDMDLRDEALSSAKKGSKKKMTTEIVGDGEEIEVEEGDDISKNELDMIYKKHALIFASAMLLTFTRGRNRMTRRWQCLKPLRLSLSLCAAIKSKPFGGCTHSKLAKMITFDLPLCIHFGASAFSS